MYGLRVKEAQPTTTGRRPGAETEARDNAHTVRGNHTARTSQLVDADIVALPSHAGIQRRNRSRTQRTAATTTTQLATHVTPP